MQCSRSDFIGTVPLLSASVAAVLPRGAEAASAAELNRDADAGLNRL